MYVYFENNNFKSVKGREREKARERKKEEPNSISN